MEKVLQIVQANSIKTGNGSGIAIIRAWEKTELELPEFVQHVDQLIQQNKIVMRKGINHNLLFAL
jgi:hypothetical protein